MSIIIKPHIKSSEFDFFINDDMMWNKSLPYRSKKDLSFIILYIYFSKPRHTFIDGVDEDDVFVLLLSVEMSANPNRAISVDLELPIRIRRPRNRIPEENTSVQTFEIISFVWIVCELFHIIVCVLVSAILC